MTKSELIVWRLKNAKRLRTGDYVRGDNEEGYEVVGRVVCTTDDTVTVEDNKKREHVIMRFEAFKAARPEFEDFSMDSEDPRVLLAGNEVMEGNGLGADVTDPFDPVPAVEDTSGVLLVSSTGPATSTRPAAPRLLNPDLSRYTYWKEHRTASGRPVMDVNDQIAEAVRGLLIDDLYDFTARTLAAMGVTEIGAGKKKSGCTEADLRARYSELNVGMASMDMRNILRGSMTKLGLTALPAITWVKE